MRGDAVLLETSTSGRRTVRLAYCSEVNSHLLFARKPLVRETERAQEVWRVRIPFARVVSVMNYLKYDQMCRVGARSALANVCMFMKIYITLRRTRDAF